MKFLKNYPVVVLVLAALVISNAYTVFAVQTDKNDADPSAQQVKGAKGDKGVDGADGAQGTKGEAGATGVQGASGVAGSRGSAGSAGANGANGVSGTNGLPGVAGQTGSVGQNGLSSVALLHGSVTTVSPSSIDTTIPVDAVNASYGTFQQVVTSPTTGFNPGDQIAQFNYWSVGLVDTRIHAYNVGIAMQICDTNRGRCMTLTGWAHANNGIENDSATLTPQDVSVESSVGSGLSYDPSNGKVTSSDGFGGNFSVVIDYVGTQGS